MTAKCFGISRTVLLQKRIAIEKFRFRFDTFIIGKMLKASDSEIFDSKSKFTKQILFLEKPFESKSDVRKKQAITWRLCFSPF